MRGGVVQKETKNKERRGSCIMPRKESQKKKKKGKRKKQSKLERMGSLVI